MLSEFRKTKIRQAALQVLNILTIATAALMIWKGLSVITNTESPLVVVISESMRPAFDRGDILLLSSHKNNPVQVNDICVFKLKGRDIPIVHRVIKLHQSNITGEEYILTKGDNNPVDDRKKPYGEGQMWIHRENIVGKVKGIVPYIGFPTIWINEHSWLKFALIGVFGLLNII